jgi:hypothetical protein
MIGLGPSDLRNFRGFIDEVRTFHTTGSFSSPEGLARGVAQRLRKIAAEELSPWCKLGPAVFRARRIRYGSQGLEVEAHVLDDEVGAFLESLRPSGWASGDTRFTEHARSVMVRVTDVESTMSASRGRDLFMKMEVQQGGTDPFLGTTYSVGGRSYNHDDLVALALAEACQGGRLPPEKTRLAHKLCNSEDYWRNPIHAEKRARRAMKWAGDHLEEAAANAAAEDLAQWEAGMRRWAETLEPEMRERQLRGIEAYMERHRTELAAEEVRGGQEVLED